MTSKAIPHKMWELMREQLGGSGRHPYHALSARTIQTAKGTGRARKLGDGGGLYLLVAPSGSKSWLLRTVVHGRRCDIGLGSAGLVSLAEARDEAHRLRQIARCGGDPLAQRRHTQRAVPTFEEAAKQVHAVHGKSFKNDKHRKQWLASLSGAISAFGAKRLDTVSSADVLQLLSVSWLTTPETARRVLQRLRVIFDWSKAQGFYTGDNPTLGLTKVLPKHRALKAHHAALPYAEVRAFVQILRAADAAETVRLALEFTILCAARTSETLLATWEEINLPPRQWTIQGTRMKSGVEHRVPLSDRCVEILERMSAAHGNQGYVFPGRGANKPLSNMVFLMALRRMKREDLTAHGFRSSFRDWAAERTNFPHAVCEAALAHRIKDKAEAAYNRTDLFDRRRELMAMWAAFCAGPSEDVVTDPVPSSGGLNAAG